jgi:very-short-patch-repair endonuclease
VPLRRTVAGVDVPSWLDDVVPLLDPTALPRVLTLREAASLGHPFHVVRRQVRRGRWLRLAPGVYCTTPPATLIDHLTAATKHGGAGAVVSGTAAVHAYGLRSAPRPERELVLVPASCGARSCGRIVVRRTANLPSRAARPGPALAPVARAVVDHARTLTRLGDVRAVIAETVQRELTNVDQLWAEVEIGGRNGRALVRQAVLEVTAGSQSAPEAKAAGLLTAAGLGPFEQNALLIVGGRNYYPDFLWRAARAILEVDSFEHHFRRDDWQRTLDRHFVLEAAGYSVIHVPPSTLDHGAQFVARIRIWLQGRDQLALGA